MLNLRAIILAAFVLLCALNAVIVPVFEAPDEVSHYTYAAYLARERRLPDLSAPLPAHEAAQPPLYYALVALVISPFDQSDLASISKLNPDWFDRALNPDFVTVAHQHIRTDAETFPWRGAVWAVRAARLFSTLLGVLTLLGVFSIAQSVFPKHPLASLLAGAAVAFTPKFVHVASIVSNDIALVCAATLACAWLCKILVAPGPATPRHWLIQGALIGSAVLCKLGGLGLLAPVAITLFARDRARWPRAMLWIGLGLLLTCGPWLAYNTAHYGDPLALGPVAVANAPLLRPTPLGIVEIVNRVPVLFSSYFGLLGVGFELPVWSRLIFAACFLVALLGCVRQAGEWLVRKPQLRAAIASPLAALIIWQLALTVLFIPWLRQYAATENSRLLMPGIACAAMLVTAGWLRVAGEHARSQRIAAVLASAALFATAFAAPFTTLQPAFATPQVFGESTLLNRFGKTGPLAVFDGKVALIHATIAEQRLRSNEPVRVTLYWGARQPVEQSYRVLLEALDADGALLGRRLAIPFNGRFDTQRWQPGAFFEDSYALPLNARPEPTVLRIQISLLRIYNSPGLVPIDGKLERNVMLGRVKLAGAANNSANTNTQHFAAFDSKIALESWTFKPDSAVFTWQVLGAPQTDYTLFVKGYDAAGNQVLAQDAQPFAGNYPTGLWESGERIRDARPFGMPDSVKRIDLGWYDSSGTRLAAYKLDGTRWRDDIVIINR